MQMPGLERGQRVFGLDRLLKVIDPDPVVINQAACLRARHASSSCRACSGICPAEAIGFAKRKLTVDAARCTKCGLCLGACPTAALQVRGIDESLLDGVAVVRCQQAMGEGAILPCLGALSVDHLVDLGSRQPGVTLLAGDCQACRLAAGGTRARANLAAAAELLKALGVSPLPQWRSAQPPGGGADERRSVSRRDLLSLWGHSAVQTGRTLLPDREVNRVKLPTRVPARRLRWLKRFSPPEHTERLPWPSRLEGATCNGCNLCVGFCPTGALAAETAGDVWSLSYQAAACVDCHTCIELCPRQALSAGEPPTVAEVLGGGRRTIAEARNAGKPQAPQPYGGFGYNDLG